MRRVVGYWNRDSFLSLESFVPFESTDSYTTLLVRCERPWLARSRSRDPLAAARSEPTPAASSAKAFRAHAIKCAPLPGSQSGVPPVALPAPPQPSRATPTCPTSLSTCEGMPLWSLRRNVELARERDMPEHLRPQAQGLLPWVQEDPSTVGNTLWRAAKGRSQVVDHCSREAQDAAL